MVAAIASEIDGRGNDAPVFGDSSRDQRAGCLQDGPLPGGIPAPARPAAQRPEDTGDWQPAGPTGLGGGVDPDLPAAHVLEAAVTVRETAAGPELTLSLAAPRELISAQAQQELAGYWAAALDGIAAHAARPGVGGHIPSDFPS